MVFLVIAFVLVLGAGCARRPAPPDVPVTTATFANTGGDLKIGAWQSELPADVVLVLDQSGSMSQGAHPTDPGGLRVRDSASLLEFVASRSDRTAPNRFGVVNFGTTAPQADAVPLTPISSLSDPALARLRRQLRPLNLSDTSFISALTQADRMLHAGGSFRQSRNRAIVIFTDGQPDDARKLSQAAYFAELKAFVDRVARPEGVRIFIVGIDTVGRNWSATAPHWRRVVGPDQVFTAADFQALQSQFNRIVQRIYHLPEVPPTEVVAPQHVDFTVAPYLAAVEFHIFPSRQGVTLNVYRPGGKKVVPGHDADTPLARQLSTFQRLVVYAPQPGVWHYEASGGRVIVLRNPIPLHMALVSPARVHPRGKPMTLIAQFRRADGKPVQSDPDYPLGLSAEVVMPGGRRVPVKFPLDKGQGSVYTGEPVIQDTMTGGNYQIILKVNGGGKYEYQYPVTVQVRDVPYLMVDAPSAGTLVSPGKAVAVRARLMQGGKPLLPQSAFSNHPDQLVMAQVRSEDGGKANKVYVASVPDANGSAGGTFAGSVPMPSATPGQYTLAVALAPEEKAKQAVADETVFPFRAGYPPPPWWRPFLLWGVPVLLALAVLGALLRKRRADGLRLPFYYRVHGQPIMEVLTLTQADEQRVLTGVPLRITRQEGQRKVRIDPTEEAQLFRSDGTAVPTVEAAIGGLLQFMTAAGQARSLSYGFQPDIPLPPQPNLTEAENGTGPKGDDDVLGYSQDSEPSAVPDGGDTGSGWDVS